MEKKAKKRLAVALASGTAVLLVIGIVLVNWGITRKNRAEAIRQAMLSPEHVDPEKLLLTIDDKFSSLSEEERQKALADDEQATEYIAKATRGELQKSFKLLFKLPKSVRERVIAESAEDLRKKALAQADKVSEFYDSTAGEGALRGASRFFLLDLSGEQKSESAPLTQAMYEIVKRQAERKRGK